MLWKNGAGVTSEIVRDGLSSSANFGWRISIADIEAGGSFSSFEGYQRIITVIEGDGMRLTVDGQVSRDLRAYDAFAFSGDAKVECTLLGSNIRDFNLIYNPELFGAHLHWIEPGKDLRIHTSASAFIAFNAGRELTPIRVNSKTWKLDCYDTLSLSESEGLVEVQIPATSVDMCLIELHSVRG